MSLHEKERNKKMPTPIHKVTHNPIPTSLTCCLFVIILLWGKAPTILCAARAHTLHTRTCARGQRPARAGRPLHARTCTNACYGVVLCLPVKSPTIYRTRIYGERRTIAWCPCTPPSTMETFGEKISAEAYSGKEIAGLLKKKS